MASEPSASTARAAVRAARDRKRLADAAAELVRQRRDAEQQASNELKRKRREEEKRLADEKRRADERRAQAEKSAEVIARRLLDHCVSSAVVGAHKAVLAIQAIEGDEELQRMALEAVAHKLELWKVQCEPLYEAWQYCLSWRDIEWEQWQLSPTTNPGHLAWLSSVSGQGLLHNIWAAIQKSADKDRFEIELKLTLLPKNPDRWGDNAVAAVSLHSVRMGILPAPISYLIKVLKGQKYGCKKRSSRLGFDYLKITW